MNRIKAINSLIENCQCVYDVGSDHALLAISLLKDKKVKQIVNIEIASGPLKMGLANLAKNHLTTKTLNVENNGLKDISKKVFAKPNFVCIAGMGGDNIIKILSEKDKKIINCNYVLEANTEIHLLRKWLAKNNWTVLKELTIFDRGKYYQIMVVNENKNIKKIDTFISYFGQEGLQLDSKVWYDYLKFVKAKIIAKKLDKFNPVYKTLLKQINLRLKKNEN